MNRSLKGICFTVAGGCCWGMSGVMGKYLFDAKDLTATWLVTVRLLGAGICLLLLMYQRKGNSIFRVWKRKDSAVNQLIFGMIGMAMCQMTYFLAIQESNPGTATVIQYSAPILIMVFFVLVEKRFPKKEEVLVLATVIVGIFLLATHGSIKNLVITNAALFWGLLSAFAFAVYNVQPKKLLDEFGTLETTGWGMFVGGVLYIPVAQMDLIQKYAGADAKKPRLNKLGTIQWGKTKSQVKKAVQIVAKDLVELYAVRQQSEGFVYGPDTVWQKEFEEMFPFEETDDQLQAIEDTKHDMESKKIMDRLICGDVGYGKTEIAIRAAFKAVQEGKQVVCLVPTTILAQQHYNTFVQRLKEFPVRIDLLCRFRSAAEQKKTIEDTKKGFVDILVGTHRVLSKDVVFKDLGLLIIDEEQRFGVTHKEKIKKLKENIDVLTLTATPIPRTLHMSLIGIRDMSVLEEAPNERMPIQTYVMEYNDEMVREAITRELARDGQVYYVYNRVNDIADVAGRIQGLVPDANVAFAHGQMKERELEDIMYDFINGDIDVLVSTTIIETGLDIPNANTMIIQDADRFGLSQLYQLRGRVGRSNRMAYAFLLYQRDKLLKEVAEKRLSAIREFTDLGSGIKIAMRDLEIRGAGNLLGEAQSGHMEAVGYDLYCKMLNEAVRQLKGGPEAETFTTLIDLNVDAYIPEYYIKNEYQKLDIYKRIAAIESEEELEDMTEELIDRFGDIPKKVQQLLVIASLKSLAHSVYVTAIEQKGEEIRFTMYEKAKIDPSGIPKFLDSYKNDLIFRAEEPPYFLYCRKGRNKKSNTENVLDTVRRILEDLKKLT